MALMDKSKFVLTKTLMLMNFLGYDPPAETPENFLNEIKKRRPNSPSIQDIFSSEENRMEAEGIIASVWGYR